MEFFNLEFVLSGSKKKCTRTVGSSSNYLRSAQGWFPLVAHSFDNKKIRKRVKITNIDVSKKILFSHKNLNFNHTKNS